MAKKPTHAEPKFWIDDHPDYAAYANDWHDRTSSLHYAPKALLDRLKANEVTIDDIKKNNQHFAQLLKDNKSPRVIRHALTEYGQPIAFNPNVWHQNIGTGSFGKQFFSLTFLGNLLVHSKYHEVIPDFLDAGFDSALFPDEPFIHAAIKHQPLHYVKSLNNVSILNKLYESGANIHVQHEKLGNAIYTALDRNKDGSAALAWLLERSVTPYEAQRHVRSVGHVTPFEYHSELQDVDSEKLTLLLRYGSCQIISEDNELGYLSDLDDRDTLSLNDVSGNHHTKPILETHLKNTQEYLKPFIKHKTPIHELSRQDVLLAYSVDESRLLDLSRWQGHEDTLAVLYADMPPHIKLWMNEHSIDEHFATFGLARTTISGPAHNWSALETQHIAK